MNLSERRKAYKAIEEYRKRPLIVYVTSTRQGVESQLSEDAVREFIDQIDAIKASSEVDVMIQSTGGDALAAWKLMSILRERFDEVYVLVPYTAFSAATLFALGADEIVMHPYASLGPIDPQITIYQPDTGYRQFAYEDVGAFLRFLANDVKISEQVHISAIINNLFSAVDPVNVGGAKRASELSFAVGERMLLLHMTDAEEKPKAKEIAENLNKSFFAHGDAVSRSRALQLGLRIADRDLKLEELMWDAYLGIEDYLKLREPFDSLQEVLKHHDGAQVLRPIPPLQLPANSPPHVVQDAWQSVIQMAIDNLSTQPVEVDFEIVGSLVEGVLVASEFRTTGKLQMVWNQDGSTGIIPTVLDQGWKKMDNNSVDSSAVQN